MTNILTSLRKITLAVIDAGGTGNVEAVLQEIAHTARELVMARYAALGIPDGEGHLAHFLISGLRDEERNKIAHPPIGKGLLGAIMIERVALRLPNISADARSAGFPEHHPEMKTFLGVPIQIGETLLGMLYLSDKLNGEMFSQDDQTLVETLAGYAALALGGIELSESQKRLSRFEERERIAMELHDSVIQLLYAVGMELQLLKADFAHPEVLTAPIRHVDEVIAEIRRYIMNLKSAEARRLTIQQGLKATLDRLYTPPTLTISLDAPDEYPPVDTPTFDSICQVCSELASNAIRHSHAHTLRIRAQRLASEFVLTVEDDGVGFDVQDTSPGLGLANIRRRAQLFGGMVELYSSKGNGTCVRITFPIH
jgi:signal transduction histidine kinase